MFIVHSFTKHRIVIALAIGTVASSGLAANANANFQFGQKARGSQLNCLSGLDQMSKFNLQQRQFYGSRIRYDEPADHIIVNGGVEDQLHTTIDNLARPQGKSDREKADEAATQAARKAAQAQEESGLEAAQQQAANNAQSAQNGSIASDFSGKVGIGIGKVFGIGEHNGNSGNPVNDAAAAVAGAAGGNGSGHVVAAVGDIVVNGKTEDILFANPRTLRSTHRQP